MPQLPSVPAESEPIEGEVTPVARDGHSIRIASRITGLSVDTLRMWERRYGFPSPVRNSVGNRLYREADVERLVLVAKAMKMGYRAGEAIRLNADDLDELLANQTLSTLERERGPRPDVEPLLDRISSHDPEGLKRELRRLAGVLGAKQFITDVCAPLVEAVGEAWAKGELFVHHEHLMTDILLTQLRLLGAMHGSPDGPRMLLATLPREYHGLGLEMVAWFAQVLGAQVHSLGTNTPPLELVRACAALRAQAIALSISTSSPAAGALAQIVWLAERLPNNVEVWLGGKGSFALEGLPSRVRVMKTWDELELAVTGLVRKL